MGLLHRSLNDILRIDLNVVALDELQWRDFGKGRLAWIAVGPERAATTGTDHRLLLHVLEAAVAWSSRMPSVEVLPWPGGAPFAPASWARGKHGASSAS